MTTMKNYRAITIGTEENIVSVMMVHDSIDKSTLYRILAIYQDEVELRELIIKIDNLKHGDEHGITLNDRHKLNILKKIIRLDPVCNRMMPVDRYMVNGNIVDLKDWKKMDRMKMNVNDAGITRVIETADEIEFYRNRGVLKTETVMMEAVYFVDMKN